MQIYTIPAFGGGINDNAALFGGMREDESIELVNLALDGRGKMSFRRGCNVTDVLLDAGGSEVKAVLGVWAFASGALAASWQDDATDGLAIDGDLAISAVSALKFKTTATATFYISETQYTKAATDNLTFTAAHTVTQGQLWGAIAIQINAAGTVSTKVVSDPQAYATEAAAIAALPSADASNVLLGYITIQSLVGADWDANTHNMTPAGECDDSNFYNWYEVANSVDLHVSTAQDGTGFAYSSQMYSDVSAIVDLSAQAISAGGGGDAVPDSTWPAGWRMYFCAVDGSQSLKFFANDDSTVYEVTREFRPGEAAEALYPRAVAEFNYHLFAGGYKDASYTGYEVLRYSTPGLIAIDDISSGEEAGESDLREWHQEYFESVGQPGENVMWMAKAGGGLIVGKENNIHKWHGYDSATWGQVHLDGQYGAINAAHVVADNYVYYMSPFGPCRTNGHGPSEFIGHNIQTFVDNVEALDKTVITHDPTKFQVQFWFIDSRIDSSYASKVKTWSYLASAWTETEYFKTQADLGQLTVFSGGVLGTTTVPGPTAGPNTLAATESLESYASCTHEVSITWVNGDTAPTTWTQLYRIKSESAPDTADWPSGGSINNATLVATLGSGVASYQDDITASTSTYGKKYWYQIRHIRNGQYSNWNTDNSDPAATDVSVVVAAAPSAPTAPSGETTTDDSHCDPECGEYYSERVSWTNNHGGHANEQYCSAEVYGWNTQGTPAWELLGTVGTWNGSSTNATSYKWVYNVYIGSSVWTYSKYKIRIIDARQVCGDTYKYSSYTSEVNSAIVAEYDCSECTEEPDR
jgi:hypothetical protein